MLLKVMVTFAPAATVMEFLSNAMFWATRLIVTAVPPEAVVVVLVVIFEVVEVFVQELNANSKPVIVTAANILPECVLIFIFMVLNALLLQDIMLI